MPKDNKRKSTDAARRIWLAGIGAYGRAFTEAQEAIKDVTGKGSDVFDELVQKGEMLEMVGKAKGKEVLDKAKVPDFKVPDFDIDDRIKAMRSRLSGGSDAPIIEDNFEARLSAVEAKLDKVLGLLEPKKNEPKTPRKKPAKKTTTQRTTKTKKTAAKKTTAKK